LVYLLLIKFGDMRNFGLAFLLVLSFMSILSCQSKQRTENSIPPVSLVKSDQVFGPNRTFQVGLVDLDSDGDLDAVLPNRGQIHSQILINDGKGYFTDSGQKLARQTHGMGIGDWDNDGDQDIVFTTAGYGLDGVYTYLPTSVYLNDGQAVFKETGQELCMTVFAWVVLGDLNGDGFVDAYISNMGSPNQIWLGDGTGQFIDSGLRFNTEGETRGCVLGDLDSDGDLDVFVANFYQGCNEIWFNTLK